MASGSHADRIIEQATSGSAAALSPLVASWRRSLVNHGLVPDLRAARRRVSARELRLSRDRLARLIAVAAHTLDRLFLAVGTTGCCVLLTDAGGVIVDVRCAAGYRAAFEDWGLSPGGEWSETVEGTNAIGTCLVDQRPVTIHRDQHFLSRNTEMSCTAAPIFGADGRLLASLDVTSCRAEHTEDFTALIAAAVTDAAQRIEAEHFATAYSDARIVVGSRHGQAGTVLLAVDRDDLMIGATQAARKAYGLNDRHFQAPRPATDVLPQPDGNEGLDAAERAELRRALARTGGNVSAAALALGISRATLYRRLNRHGLT